MTNLLIKLFIQDKDKNKNGKDGGRERYGILSGVAGIVLNTILFALKLAVGLLINSISVTADAFNNLADSAGSILTLFGFKIAGKPADREHPFGHGRSEEIVSLVIAASILLLGYEFIRSSINHIINPPEMYSGWLFIGLLALAALVKVWMFAFNRKLGKAIGSSTLHAIAIDSRNDVVITGVTIVSVLFTAVFGIVIDGFVGLFVAVMLIKSGIKLAKDNLSTILGRPLDRATADEIKQIILSHEGFIGVHDLIVHNYGPGRKLATIHGEVPLDTPFAVSHAMGEAAESVVLERLGIHIIIRLDPVDIHDERLHHLKEHITGFLDKAHPEANAHDFRMLKDTFIFDLEVPHEYKKGDQAKLLAAVEAIVKAAGEEYECIVNLEHGYIEP